MGTIVNIVSQQPAPFVIRSSLERGISTNPLIHKTYVAGVHTCNQEERTATVLAYVGWPFRVDCDHLRHAWEELNPGLASNITKVRL